MKGRLGPTLAYLRGQAPYKALAWTQDDRFFCMKTQGYLLWTVPRTGTYGIRAFGAASMAQTREPSKGRARYFGLGAIVYGEFALRAGDILTLLCGQQPEQSQYHGGSGGTFVCRGADKETCTPMLVAAGAGSHCYYNHSNPIPVL